MIAGVRATISDPAYQRRIQRRVEEMFALRPSMDQKDFRAVEKEIEENVRSVERLTRAIEQGAPVESIVKRIRELEGLREKLETRKLEILRREVRLTEGSDIAKTVREYVASWGTEFDGMSVESKRWMIRKIVTGVTVDKKERVVRFGLRTIPAVTDAVGEAYVTLEKTKTAPGDQMPFRRTLVAGTRLIVYR